MTNPDMPADIAAAIEAYVDARIEVARLLAKSLEGPINAIYREAQTVHAARSALDAAILARLAAAEAARGEAIAERDKLAAFAREIIEPAFDGMDLDGGTIQRLAVHYGLLIATQYDPKRHGASFADPGADWFEWAGPLATPTEEA